MNDWKEITGNCPVCSRVASKVYRRQVDATHKAYGQVPEHEYQSLSRNLPPGPKNTSGSLLIRYCLKYITTRHGESPDCIGVISFDCHVTCKNCGLDKHASVRRVESIQSLIDEGVASTATE